MEETLPWLQLVIQRHTISTIERLKAQAAFDLQTVYTAICAAFSDRGTFIISDTLESLQTSTQIKKNKTPEKLTPKTQRENIAGTALRLRSLGLAN